MCTVLVLCSCSRAALALFLSLTFARFARDRPLTWAPGGRACTALVVLCEPDGAPPVATTVPAVADQPQASGRQDAVQHEPSPRPRKKKRRPKGPARIAKERSRMQAYLESAKFVEHQCQALVTANAATATAATGGGGGGTLAAGWSRGRGQESSLAMLFQHQSVAARRIVLRTPQVEILAFHRIPATRRTRRRNRAHSG